MDNLSTGMLFGMLIFLICFSAFFSAAEISMMAINRYRLRHMMESGNRGAIRVSQLLKRPDRVLGIILLGNNFVNILATIVATLIALRLYGESALTAVSVILTVVILIFAEVAPKTLAATRPERIAFPAAIVLKLLLKLLYPAVWLINLVANQLLKLLGISIKQKSTRLTSQELRVAVLEAGGLIPESHQNMLLAILDLEKMTVEDVMVPRGRIVGINLDAGWEEIVEQVTSSRYTRLPVYRGTLDNTVGTVHMRKVLNLMHKGQLDREALESVIVEPYFIPEGTPLTTQLLNFREVKRRRGLVVDEYGDIMGLVTLEEILEEIVGDFTSQSTGVSDIVQAQEDGSYLIRGNASLRDINRLLNWNLPIGESRTLNGLITEHLEDLPAQGTSLMIGGYMVEIVRTNGTIVQLARLMPYSGETESASSTTETQ
ncbi:MAG: HlyC/CorC family transporter [Gammaproteobacteria bacterium]|nr:HlyC/CorC family transporter [Gammaproteobacteria bacterium]